VDRLQPPMGRPGRQAPRAVGAVEPRGARWRRRLEESRGPSRSGGRAVQSRKAWRREGWRYRVDPGNPDDWRDGEAIAGEASPPRDEQELLDELAAGVRAATSAP